MPLKAAEWGINLEIKVKNREWVKNAAIIFLAVLLGLTFFSNTIMNRTLPEVATAGVVSGSITAKVRGSGKVTANGSTEVKMKETRVIKSVLVRVGQEVEAGDVLFALGEGSSQELEEAQEKLRQLELSYQRSSINYPSANFTSQDITVQRAYETYVKAVEEQNRLYELYYGTTSSDPEKQAEKTRLENMIATLTSEITALQDEYTAGSDEITIEGTDYEQKKADLEYYKQLAALEAQKPEGERVDYTDTILALEYDIIDIETRLPVVDGVMYSNLAEYSNVMNGKINTLVSQRDELQYALDALALTDGNPTYKAQYEAAVKAADAAEDAYMIAAASLDESWNSYNKSAASSSLDLSDLRYQIEKQKEKVDKLSGSAEDKIVAGAAGVVTSISCTAGQTASADSVLCTIESADMGYTVSFSVTNDQAQRLRIGDTATISNYYWGKEVVATLTTIRNDPKNPMSGKLLTFNIEGDVTSGSDLTISVGSKSANYDYVIPNSAIRSDSNGSFVYAIEAKNSPLGNRYIARRVSVEVIASDDNNSAVTGALENGDFVITTSNSPVKNGDMVRMADSAS